MCFARGKLSAVCTISVTAICFVVQVRFAAAIDNDLTSVECQRRNGQPCLSIGYGPYTGVFVFDTGSSCSSAYGAARFQESPDPAWHFTETHGLFSVGSGSATILENILIQTFDKDGEQTRLVLLEKPARSRGLSGIDGILGLPEMSDVCVRIESETQLVTKSASPWPRPAHT